MAVAAGRLTGDVSPRSVAEPSADDASLAEEPRPLDPDDALVPGWADFQAARARFRAGLAADAGHAAGGVSTR